MTKEQQAIAALQSQLKQFGQQPPPAADFTEKVDWAMEKARGMIRESWLGHGWVFIPPMSAMDGTGPVHIKDDEVPKALRFLAAALCEARNAGIDEAVQVAQKYANALLCDELRSLKEGGG